MSLMMVMPSGAPLPRLVGFRWDGGENVFVYGQAGARIRNVASNPKVTLNFRGVAIGCDIVVVSGTAEVDESRPGVAQDAAWVAKYAADWEHAGMTPDSFLGAVQRPGERPHHRGPRVLSVGQ
jgi:PPOX class probable F420-dependent enzyme